MKQTSTEPQDRPSRRSQGQEHPRSTDGVSSRHGDERSSNRQSGETPSISPPQRIEMDWNQTSADPRFVFSNTFAPSLCMASHAHCGSVFSEASIPLTSGFACGQGSRMTRERLNSTIQEALDIINDELIDVEDDHMMRLGGRRSCDNKNLPQ